MSDCTADHAIVIRFSDATTVLTVSQACDHMGVRLSDYEDAMAELVAAGWLEPQGDGSYFACVPEVSA